MTSPALKSLTIWVVKVLFDSFLRLIKNVHFRNELPGEKATFSSTDTGRENRGQSV